MPDSVNLQIGQAAPDFVMTASDGKEVSLGDFLKTPLVLYFFPRNNASESIRMACDFRDHYDEFVKLGVCVVGSGIETFDSQSKFASKYHLPFPLLCDNDMKLSRTYGVFKPRVVEGTRVFGVERTTFVINRKGEILKIYPDVKPDGHSKEVLSFLKTSLT